MGEEVEQSESIRLRDHLAAMADERKFLLEGEVRRLDDKIDVESKSIREELRAQKELLQTENASTAHALLVARAELERRLEGLNELRKEVTSDRQQFVKLDVYTPAHEALRIQRVSDNEKSIALAAQVNNNTAEIARMQSSLMWLSRLVIGALIVLLIGYAFQRLAGR